MKRKDDLKDPFNEDRRPVDRPTPSSRPTAVLDNFLSDNHSPNDTELVPLNWWRVSIELNETWKASERKGAFHSTKIFGNSGSK